MSIILIILIVLLLAGGGFGLHGGHFSSGSGPYLGGGLGLVVIVLLVLMLTGRL